VIINFVWLLMGLIMIGVSSWGITQQREDPVTAGA
jgi:hypothetical protein